MTPDQQLELEAKKLVADLPESERALVNQCIDELRQLRAKYGDSFLLAMAVVGTELQAES